MTAGTLHDTGAPTIDVRIYRNGILAPDELLMSDDEDYVIASATIAAAGLSRSIT